MRLQKTSQEDLITPFPSGRALRKFNQVDLEEETGQQDYCVALREWLYGGIG